MGRRSSDVERLPPYVSAYTTRHGKRRYRFRKTGMKTYFFKDHPGTPKHPSAEYQRVAAGQVAANDSPKITPGTIDDLVNRYYGTTAFTNPSKVTQEKVRAILEDFRRAHGRKRVANLKFNHVEAILSAKAKPGTNAAGKRIGGPNAAKSLEKHLKRVFDLAIKLEMITVNPVRLAEKVKVPKTTGFHTWTEDEIAQFRRHYPIGTKPRLALEIVLWTLQRRGDAARFGPKQRQDGMIQVWNEKTQKMTWVPEPKQLTAAIEAMPAVGMSAFLVTEFGKPFSVAGFGNWFRDRCNEAGLPHCTLHGLRKATARRLAEMGKSQQELKAAGGWSGDREVATYTASADQRRLATTAMTELASWDLAHPASEVRQTDGESD